MVPGYPLGRKMIKPSGKETIFWVVLAVLFVGYLAAIRTNALPTSNSSSGLAEAMLQWRSGQTERALELARDLETRAQSSADLVSIGDFYQSIGRIGDATRVYRRAIEINPRNAIALNNYGYMLADRGVRLQEALRLTRRAVELQPNNAAFLDSLGWTCYRLGRYSCAQRYLLEAARRAPDDPTVRLHLGLAYQKARRMTAARIELQKTLLLSPGNPLALRALREMDESET